MRVGIIGDAKRAVAWETHLRPFEAVREVVIAPTLDDLGTVDAAILIDDSINNLHLLSDAIRLGIHSYLVSRLPSNRKLLEKVYHQSQEASVCVQFSHWPSIAPSTRWMIQQMPKPELIQVIRENSTLNYTDNRGNFNYYWMDELALIIKWMSMSTHRIETKEITLERAEAGLQIHIKFESGSAASIFFLATGMENRHRRIVSDRHLLLDLDVTDQNVRAIRQGGEDHLDVTSKKFDATRVAELSAILFLKSIQMNQESAFTPYDALTTANSVEKIKRQLQNPGS